MTEPKSQCPEFGQGAFDAPLLCDRPFGHNGEHHCPRTDAAWSVLA